MKIPAITISVSIVVSIAFFSYIHVSRSKNEMRKPLTAEDINRPLTYPIAKADVRELIKELIAARRVVAAAKTLVFDFECNENFPCDCVEFSHKKLCEALRKGGYIE